MKLKQRLQEYMINLSRRLLNTSEHRRVIHLYTFAILLFVSLVMTIINSLTKEVPLGVATAIFAVCCGINFLLQIMNKEEDKISSVLFGIEFMFLLMFFIIFGYPGGFSILWIVLVPPVAMLFYGIKDGTIFSGVCLIVLIIFLWLPFGQNLVKEEAIYSIAHSKICTSDVKYSEIFRLRFPFLYMATYILSLVLETIKQIGFKEIQKVNKNNQFLSEHDVLTNLYNRVGYRNQINLSQNTCNFNKVCVMICDVDHFKNINDTYGHFVGDFVLKEFASIFEKTLGGLTCRYGGDEFAFIAYDDEQVLEKLALLKNIVEDHTFKIDNIRLKTTVSIGVYMTDKAEFDDVDFCLKKADDNLYQAKNNGKNLLVITYKESK